MSASDGLECPVVSEQCQGVVDTFHEVAPSFSHTERVVLTAVGPGQDGEAVVLADEGARRLFVLHNTAQLTLEQRLDSVGCLREPFDLRARTVVLHG